MKRVSSAKKIGRMNRNKTNTFTKLKEKKKLNLKRIVVWSVKSVVYQGRLFPYSIGYRQDEKSDRIYYITDYIKTKVVLVKDLSDILEEGGSLMIRDFISDLDLISSNKIIFTHDQGRFDGYFLLKELVVMKELKNILIDDQNWLINFNYKNQKGKSLTWKDSSRILPCSLGELSRIYDVEYKEWDKEISIGNIFGDKDKSFRKEVVQYLESDLWTIYTILKRASQLIFEDYGVNLLEAYSTSSLAMKIFRTKYLKKDDKPKKLHPLHDNLIRESYYGGMTNLYKPYGRGLYHYDVNSLYPYSMLKAMPGDLIRKSPSNSIDLENFFGFLRIKIQVDETVHKPLAIKRDKSGLINPVGSWTGLYFSEEVKAFLKWGYKIEILYGIEFTKIYPFKEWVHHFYKLKKEAYDATSRFTYKLLLNGLYGYFGRKNYDNVIEVQDAKGLDQLIWNYSIENVYGTGEKFLVKRSKKPSEELKNKSPSKYIELSIKSNLNRHIPFSNVAIASAIASYSRIHIGELILGLDGECYYSDTDSIITDLPVSPDKISDKIGDLKLENEIEEAYFISPKLYAFKTKDGTEIIKSRGIPENKLNYLDYEKIFRGEELKLRIKKSFKSIDTLSIHETTYTYSVKLSEDSKRENIYDQGKWVDTKPLKISLS